MIARSAVSRTSAPRILQRPLLDVRETLATTTDDSAKLWAGLAGPLPRGVGKDCRHQTQGGRVWERAGGVLGRQQVSATDE